nr:MAG TPA: Helicase HerA, central domain [Caudoviricetes sp.]
MKITLADWTKYLNFHPRPKGGEVHRMMISQTGSGKAFKARS